jgi:hypothetical protein
MIESLRNKKISKTDTDVYTKNPFLQNEVSCHAFRTTPYLNKKSLFIQKN